MCHIWKHSKLLERPPELLWKRDLIFQKPSATDGLAIIAEDDWRLFCEDWGGTESKGISATIEIDSDVKDDNIGTCIDMSIPGEHINDGINNGSSPRLLVKTSPQVCEECVGDGECSELMRKLRYSNEDICVCLFSGKEPPKSILEASESISEPCRRTSKRSRKSTYGNSVNLNVSGTTLVYQLKMMIWETFGVVKENHILHRGSRVIDGETASLADMNIFPGDIQWVIDSKIHENRDIADELSSTNLEVHVTEEGFRGTLLSSHVSYFISSCLRSILELMNLPSDHKGPYHEFFLPSFQILFSCHFSTAKKQQAKLCVCTKLAQDFSLRLDVGFLV